jgi:hypothetical protein
MSDLGEIAGAGRSASIARRRALSAGKTALPPAAERARPGPRAASAPEPMPLEKLPPVVFVPTVGGSGSCRDQARARRAERCQLGNGTSAVAVPTRPPRSGSFDYAPEVVGSSTQAGGQVTGVRIGPGSAVTGITQGARLPVSGTQYIGTESGSAFRAGAPKIGYALTDGGSIVSGTLVRSKVAVTGDEAGSDIAITGDVDPRIGDDRTVRGETGASTAAQFARQMNPHGPSAAGTNLGRSVQSAGSRYRDRQHAIELTQHGLPITGVAGVPPVRVIEAALPAAQTWSGQRVTGADIEAHRLVSGAAAGASAAITGTPYQGADTPYRRSPDESVEAIEGKRSDITGTPYGADRVLESTLPADAVATLDRRFSIRSPQRTAALQAASRPQPTNGRRITGPFTRGDGKVTGNLEFLFASRRPTDESMVAARLRVTGEGRAGGGAITGSAWTEHKHVAGTEGSSASDRNPSLRGGRREPFAGAARFKSHASAEEPKHLVTGMFGYSSDNAAKVTLSGGAQG